MTEFTPEQLGMLAKFASSTWPRPWNMRAVSRDDWEDLVSATLLACYKCRALVRGREELPKSAGNLEPIAHFWLQRLKAEFEKWLRRQKAKERPTVDSTLDSLLPGTAALDPLLLIEAEESVRDRARLKPRERKALPPGVSRTFEPVQRAVVPRYGDSVKNGPLGRVDRELQQLDAMPRWGKECCESRCWRCSYHEGFKRPANHRPSRLVLDPEMQAVIDAIDNRKAAIAADKDRLSKCSRGGAVREVKARMRTAAKPAKRSARVKVRRAAAHKGVAA